MVPRMQILKEDDAIVLKGDFFEEGMDLDEVREYFLDWLKSYPQDNIENMKLFYTTKDRKEEFQLH